MQLEYDRSVQHLHTFGTLNRAHAFVCLQRAEEAQELRTWKVFQSLPHLVLGGGSNVLFTRNYEGLIIQNRMLGMEVLKETPTEVVLAVNAGETWDALVAHCVARGWGGLENLSLIPGCVGASPMQNIGAYGVEVKETIEWVEALEWESGKTLTFSNAECAFGYRESVFKHTWKDRLIITRVAFRLQKQPVLRTTYGAIQEELDRMGAHPHTLASIREAVMRIRQSKLPDPAVLGNAGSFFKNPVIPKEQADALLQRFPNAVHFPQGEHMVKLAAGWLIEKAGWKGFRRGDAGVHHLQALVLVNFGGATGTEIWQLSQDIITSVHNTFGVMLEREVNLV